MGVQIVTFSILQKPDLKEGMGGRGAGYEIGEKREERGRKEEESLAEGEGKKERGREKKVSEKG